MALTPSVRINGFDVRETFGMEIESIIPRGPGPVRRSSTPLGERPGRVGQHTMTDEAVFTIAGHITGTSAANRLSNFRSFLSEISPGRDGRRTFIFRLEDSGLEWICQYNGGFEHRPISKAWFNEKESQFICQFAAQRGSALRGVSFNSATGLSDKKCLMTSNSADYSVRPLIQLTNTNAAAVTAVTFRNYAKRRVMRKITGTMSAAFAPAVGAYGLGINIPNTGSNTFSFVNSGLWPSQRGWTILFRFKRVFTTGNRTFWQTSQGSDKLVYDSASDQLQVILNGSVIATFSSALVALSTSSFVQVAVRHQPVFFSSTSNEQATIFVGATEGTAANGSPVADPGANLYFFTDNAGGTRAEGIGDEIALFSQALPNDMIIGLANSFRPIGQHNLEGLSLYVSFDEGVDGIGQSNLDMTFSSISLGQNSSLMVDCEKQTAKIITSAFGITDVLDKFSGEFMELEPGTNMLQLLVTGGGASGNDIYIPFANRSGGF